MAYCGPRGIALSQFLRWPRTDQDAALAWAAFEGRRCRTCGTHPDEWADDSAAFHAHLQQCKGCQAQQRLAETPEAKQGRGVTVVMAAGPAGACPRCRPPDDD
jgi:hypothetical protein